MSYGASIERKPTAAKKGQKKRAEERMADEGEDEVEEVSPGAGKGKENKKAGSGKDESKSKGLSKKTKRLTITVVCSEKRSDCLSSLPRTSRYRTG